MEDIRQWGSLPLRLGLGIMFVLHGAQKTFGMFGGVGIENFTKFVASLGIKPVVPMAYIAAYGELIGGIMLIIGLGTRIASVLLFGIIVVAGVTVHLENGFFLQDGGVEYTFIIACGCLALTLMGTGKWGLNKSL